MTEDERALVWLCGCTALDYRERELLLCAADSPAKLFEDWEKISPGVINSEKSGLYMKGRTARESELDALLRRMERQGRFAVTRASKDYPERLKQIFLSPHVLFGEGSRELLQTQFFCIVGSRITPPWAEKVGRTIAGELARRFTVVTGLAEGGDGAAIAGAIGSGKLACVLPTGLDGCYPASHASLKERVRRAGLLLSEYPDNTPVRKYTFHERNRILAGLSAGTLVLSAGKRSGALITANYALEYNRDVFALPHNVGAAQGVGCNGLIQNGAYLVTEAEDILSCYGYASEKREEVGLPPEEERVLSVLRELGEAHVSAVAEKTGMQIYEAAAILSALEIKNMAVKSGGNRYAAV